MVTEQNGRKGEGDARGWGKGEAREKPLYETGTNKSYVSFFQTHTFTGVDRWCLNIKHLHLLELSAWMLAPWETEDSFHFLGNLLIWVLHRRSANYSPRAKSSPLYIFCMACELRMVFISNGWKKLRTIFCHTSKWYEIQISMSANKVLLANSHTFVCVLSMAALVLHQPNVQIRKYLLEGPLRKKFVNSCFTWK